MQLADALPRQHRQLPSARPDFGQQPARLSNALAGHNAEFTEQPAHLIDQGGTLGDRQGARPMNGEDRLGFF